MIKQICCFLLLVTINLQFHFADKLIHFKNKKTKPVLAWNIKEHPGVEQRKGFYTVDTLFGEKLIIGLTVVKKIEDVKGIYDTYQDKKNKIGFSEIKKLVKLADWCAKKKLYSFARLHYEEALKADPESKKVKKKLERLEKTLKKMKEKEERYRKKHQDAFVYRVTYDYEVSDELLMETAKEVQASNKLLYLITGGFAYLKEVTIEVGPDNGDFRVRKDKQNSELRGAKGVTAGSVVYIEENFHHITFVHELAHLEYGVPDEYIPATSKPCTSCLVADMVFQTEPGDAYENQYIHMICDEYTHDGEGPPCWDRLKQKKYKHKGIFLRPEKEHPKAPPVKIKIVRKGKVIKEM